MFKFYAMHRNGFLKYHNLIHSSSEADLDPTYPWARNHWLSICTITYNGKDPFRKLGDSSDRPTVGLV
jgi:hypothetical protein